MTTRRLPRGPAPPRGLIGLLGLPGIRRPSVDTSESRIDGDVLAQHSIEAAAGERPLEAGQAPARVDAAPRERATRLKVAAHRGETDQFRLRRLATAAGAGPDGRVAKRQERGPPRSAAWQPARRASPRPGRPRSARRPARASPLRSRTRPRPTPPPRGRSA